MSDFDFHGVFTADFSTGVLTWKAPPKNHAEKVGQIAGYPNRGKGKNKDYWQVRAFGRTFKRSRVIFHMANGRWPTPALDHIDGDSLNDALVNLRECSLSENAANSSRKTRSTALPRGVYLTRQGRYLARLTVRGKTANLGTFDTPEDAQAAHERARKEAFNDFA